MSSYNNIQKIKYSKTPTDVVSLHEYIIFEDTRAKVKYVVFRFSNNVNQRLFEFKFEVLQYNKDNELIEKSVVSHSDFIAEANDLFVPNAKLKINFECHSLEVRLEEAVFDRVIWRDGEFFDNSYKFDSYAETVSKQQPLPIKEEKQPKEKKKNNKKKQYKLGFNIRNISRRNHAAFPAVFNVILCIIFAALIVGSMIYFQQATGAFAIDDYVVKESSAGYVTILNYSGTEEDLEIPSTLDNRYTVTRIASGAFKNSGVKNVVISTLRELTIETGAFKNCSDLVSVTGVDCNKVYVLEGAFTNCKNLSYFNVSTAVLAEKCFDGTNNISVLMFNRILSTNEELKLLDLFNGLDSITLKGFSMDYSTIKDYILFFEGVYGIY